MAAKPEVTIDSIDDDGRGVGHLDRLEYHVSNALPGETVFVAVEHKSPHAPKAWGRPLARVGAAAEERVTPGCPGHGECGGCMLQHLAYPAQLTEKRRVLERALRAHPTLAKVKIDDVVASPREYGYRNKAKFVLAPAPDGKIIYGSYAPATHRVVDMAGCRVHEDPIDTVAGHVCALASRERVEPFDEQARTGELRYLVVRRSAAGKLLVVLVSNTSAPRAALIRVAQALRKERPDVAGVVLNVNAAHGGAIFGAEEIVLDGAGALGDTVGGVRLELSARSFFQVNRLAAERLYEEVARAAGARGGLRAVELYCGVGGIALTLARKGVQVVGIEVLEDAVADARRSAVAAHLDGRAHFRVGYAGAALPGAIRELGGVDVIIVDPPRKGLGADVTNAVLKAAPQRLVYVSCGPKSLGADLAELCARGRYTVDRVTPFDLMPGTPHVEAVATLVLKAR